MISILPLSTNEHAKWTAPNRPGRQERVRFWTEHSSHADESWWEGEEYSLVDRRDSDRSLLSWLRRRFVTDWLSVQVTQERLVIKGY